MKIQLERKLSACPDRMTCVVCHEPFWVPSIRALLYSDKHLIQGDVCRECLKLKPIRFQQKLRGQANRLIQESTVNPKHSSQIQVHAGELLETSEEQLKRPSIMHWLFKKIAVFCEENQELEAARFAASQGREAKSFNPPPKHFPKLR